MMNDKAYLYVEDDPSSRFVLQMFLERAIGAHHITVMDSSADVVEKIERLRPIPDIIFLDIHMKPINGLQLLKALRQRTQFDHSVIVALTASVMVEEIEILQEHGFNGGIAKPINQEVFERLLQQIVAGEAVWFI